MNTSAGLPAWVKWLIGGIVVLILAVLGIKVKDAYKKAKAEQK